MPDYPLTPAGKMVLAIYRQKLRDWPEAAGFPDPATIPQPEDWAAYKCIDQAESNGIIENEAVAI